MGLVPAQSEAGHRGGEDGQADDRTPGCAYGRVAQGDGPAAEVRLTELLCVAIAIAERKALTLARLGLVLFSAM